MWDAGNFAAVAEKILDAGEAVVEARRRRAGHGRCWTWRAAPATPRSRPPRPGARVTGLDFAPGLLEIARERAADAMVEIDFVEGDAQALPFDDASFDRVVSTFGHMFAPDHGRTADEMTRVLRPGRRDRGRVLDARGLDRADVPHGRRAHAAAARRPARRSCGAPRTTCARCGATPEFERHEIEWTDESVESYARFMLDSFGPLLNAREVLAEREDELERGLHGLPRAREPGRRRHAPLPRRVPGLGRSDLR